ncbi:hypothetical protein SAMN04488556_3193 [Halostagnicola kamekurae]|uniref:Uncharacterized protein n=1 Tax=Halostagnicola kamekurae TaxID=619731 RepID=A0A1I6TKY3_9EURY|nr:hypothetical protein SAMN04488556_3193 [Halostagnicola kamekurae]
MESRYNRSPVTHDITNGPHPRHSTVDFLLECHGPITGLNRQTNEFQPIHLSTIRASQIDDTRPEEGAQYSILSKARVSILVSIESGFAVSRCRQMVVFVSARVRRKFDVILGKRLLWYTAGIGASDTGVGIPKYRSQRVCVWDGRATCRVRSSRQSAPSRGTKPHCLQHDGLVPTATGSAHWGQTNSMDGLSIDKT